MRRIKSFRHLRRLWRLPGSLTELKDEPTDQADCSENLVITPLPTWLHFSLTNLCNLSCPFCWRHKKGNRNKNFVHAADDVIEQWIELINGDCEVIHPSGGGEPLLHPRFGDLVRRSLEVQASNKEGRPEIRLVTNGTLIGHWPVILEAFRDARIQAVISLESSAPEKYRFFRRGGSLQVVEKNLLAIRDARRQGSNFRPRTMVKIDCILSSHNLDDVPGLIEFAHRTGVDKIVFKRLQTSPFSPTGFRYEDSVIPQDRLLELKEMAESAGNRGVDIAIFGFPEMDCNGVLEDIRLPCEDLFRSLRFYPDGAVYTCCLVRTIAARVGNLGHETIQAIWHSKKLTTARRRILEGFPAELCNGCAHKESIRQQRPLLRKKYLGNSL